jgi:hypothetical protein
MEALWYRLAMTPHTLIKPIQIDAVIDMPIPIGFITRRSVFDDMCCWVIPLQRRQRTAPIHNEFHVTSLTE